MVKCLDIFGRLSTYERVGIKQALQLNIDKSVLFLSFHYFESFLSNFLICPSSLSLSSYMYERIDGQVRGTLRQVAIDRFSKPG